MNSYERNLAIKSDIQEHLGLLHGLAMNCSMRIVELGFRTGVSASAFLAAGAELVSYDIDKEGTRPHVIQLAKEYPSTFSFKHGDSREVEIPSCDILFIDTSHDFATTEIELNNHHESVTQLIILHDTETFGYKDRPPCVGPGIMSAVNQFLALHDKWKLAFHLRNNNGLTVLEYD